jgi:glycosyltransferase involved in cell wall biosynthesis
MPIKIAQVISTPPFAWGTGGCSRVTFELSKELSKKGYDVTILTTDLYLPNKRFTIVDNLHLFEGAKILRFKYISDWLAWKNKIYFSPSLMIYLRGHIREFDIVHLQDLISTQAIIVSRYCVKYKIPYVITAHGSVRWFKGKSLFNYFYYKFFGYSILKNASKIISVGNDDADICRELGFDESKIELIPNGLDINKFKYLPEKGTFRRLNGIPDDTKLILYVGRIHKAKGINFLVRSFSLLLNEFDDLLLIITGIDDGYKKELEQIINELGITNYVKFLGYYDKIGEVYQDANVLVYPGQKYEIFGLVPFESIICGTPVVVFEGSGCGDLVCRAKCGSTAKYGDIPDLKEQIEYLLKNPDIGLRMVNDGREYIEKELVWSSIIEKYELVYDRIQNKT